MQLIQIVPDDKARTTPFPALLAGVAPQASLLDPVPSGDGVQEVAFALRHEHAPTRTFAIDTLAGNLDARVAEIADTAFVMDSETGLLALMQAFLGQVDDPQLKGDPRYRDATTTPRRHRLITSLNTYWSGLDARVTATQHKIEEIVGQAAARRLTANSAALAADAQRYLGTTRPLADGTDRLVGSDAEALLADLRTIAAARTRLTTAERGLAAQQQAAVSELLDSRPWFLDREVRRVTSQDMAMIAQRPEVARSQANVDGRRAEFATLTARLGATRSILFRLAVSDVVQRPDERAAVAAAVASTLADATRATQNLGDLLREADKRWLFAPLVLSTLRDSGVASETFAMRVAQNRLADANGPSGFGDAATIFGQIALLGAVVGGPVEAVLGAVALVLDAVEVIVQALRVSDRQLGFDAFLDPSRAFDIDQSWDAVTLSAFFVLVGMATSGSSMRKLIGR